MKVEGKGSHIKKKCSPLLVENKKGRWPSHKGPSKLGKNGPRRKQVEDNTNRRDKISRRARFQGGDAFQEGMGKKYLQQKIKTGLLGLYRKKNKWPLVKGHPPTPSNPNIPKTQLGETQKKKSFYRKMELPTSLGILTDERKG